MVLANFNTFLFVLDSCFKGLRSKRCCDASFLRFNPCCNAALLRYNCCCDAVLQPSCASQPLSRRIDFAAAKQRAVAYRDHYRSTLFQPTEVYSSSTMRSHSVVAMLSTGGRWGRKSVCQPTQCPKHYAACLRATSAMSGCDARFPSLQYYFCF